MSPRLSGETCSLCKQTRLILLQVQMRTAMAKFEPLRCDREGIAERCIAPSLRDAQGCGMHAMNETKKG